MVKHSSTKYCIFFGLFIGKTNTENCFFFFLLHAMFYCIFGFRSMYNPANLNKKFNKWDFYAMHQFYTSLLLYFYIIFYSKYSKQKHLEVFLYVTRIYFLLWIELFCLF